MSARAAWSGCQTRGRSDQHVPFFVLCCRRIRVGRDCGSETQGHGFGYATPGMPTGMFFPIILSLLAPIFDVSCRRSWYCKFGVLLFILSVECWNGFSSYSIPAYFVKDIVWITLSFRSRVPNYRIQVQDLVSCGRPYGGRYH